ncbi:MAG TPA: DUF3299 domain-containing protein [Tepidisphaeraceae bacterium]|jgi:hypothetical protein
METSAANVTPTPIQRVETRVNWGMVIRVGIVVSLVLALVGYAMKVTYESVIQGGVVSKGDYFEVELKQMSNFEMDQNLGTALDVPERFRKLDGKQVQLEGEVAPMNFSAGDKLSSFTLCYSVAKCCFGGPPKVQHFVACKASEGKQVRNYEGSGTVRVFGTLHVNVIKDKETGKINSIFQMDLQHVEPVS